VVALDEGGRVHHAAVGDGGVGVGQLQRSDVQAVTVGHDRLFQRTPVAADLEVAGGLAGEAAAGAVAQAERAVGVVHQRRVQRHRDLRRAHVAGAGEHAGGGEQAVRVVVADV